MSDNPYEIPEAMENVAPVKGSWKSRMFELLAVVVILLLLAALLLPATRSARPAARRAQCKNNLKRIGLALHNYHDAYGALPPAYTVDSSSRPLHSWRTLILPFVEQLALYNSIDLSKPWNDPANAEAFKTMPPVYSCPSTDLATGFTSYLGVAGTDSCFTPTTSRRFGEITDDRSTTLMVVEVAEENAVPWMAPQDADPQIVLSFMKDGKLAHTGGTQVLMADGRALFLSDTMDSNTLQAMVTITGGEVVGEF